MVDQVRGPVELEYSNKLELLEFPKLPPDSSFLLTSGRVEEVSSLTGWSSSLLLEGRSWLVLAEGLDCSGVEAEGGGSTSALMLRCFRRAHLKVVQPWMFPW